MPRRLRLGTRLQRATEAPGNMSVTKRAMVFLVLVFGVSWTAVILAWSSGVRDLGSGDVRFAVYLFSPALAAVVCSIAFEKGRRVEALGLRFRPNWWWLWALLIPFGLCALTVAVTALLSPYKLVGIEGMARQYAALQHQNYSDADAYLLNAAGAVGRAIIVNSILWTFTEELGWRGYLYHLLRRFGFWRSSLVIGFIWGVWHWPMIYLFGLNYPDNRALGLVIFPICTMLQATVATVVRDRGRSVCAAGILHGTFNAVVVLTIIVVESPQFPWTVPGVSGIAALAIAVLLIAMFRPGLETSRGRDDRLVAM